MYDNRVNRALGQVGAIPQFVPEVSIYVTMIEIPKGTCNSLNISRL